MASRRRSDSVEHPNVSQLPEETIDNRTDRGSITNADLVLPVQQDNDIEKADPALSQSPKDGEDAHPESGRSRVETILVMSALCLALFLGALDVTITATAVPTITAYFHSSSAYIWVGSAYLLGNAAFVPTWGKVSDIFGRKPVLLAAIVVFWVGSLICAVSSSMGMLIVGRAIQGVGGGGIIVMPNICVSDLFSVRNRAFYLAILSVVWSVASAIGPIIGGAFSEKVSWRWCFYINLPCSGLGFIVLVFVLKLHNPRTPVKEGLLAIDAIGSLLIIGGTVMLLLGLQLGSSTYPWQSATVICLIVFGLVTIVCFVIYEWRFAKYPILPVHIFSQRNASTSYCVGFLHAFTYTAGSYWLPLYFQGVIGASATLSGVYILLLVLTCPVVGIFLGMLVKKTGNYKIQIAGGMCITTIGFGLLTDLGYPANWAKIVVYQLIAGIGISPNFQAPLIALQTGIQPNDIAAATAGFSFFRQLGTSSSVAIGGVIFNSAMANQYGQLSRQLPAKLANMLTGASAAGNIEVVGHLQGPEGDVAKTAVWHALRVMFIVYTGMAGLGAIVSLFIHQTKMKHEKHEEHKTGLHTLMKKMSNAKA